MAMSKPGEFRIRFLRRFSRTLAAFSILIVVPCPTFSQTNAAPPAVQIWDLADQLQLSDEQEQELNAIKADYEKAVADFRRNISASNVSPDVQKEIRLLYSDRVRSANQRIGSLLAAEQRERFEELRRAARRPITRTASADNADEESAATPIAPAPLLSPEDCKVLAARLRALYSQPPSKWPEPTLDESVKPHYVELGPLPRVEYPESNPYTDARAELGKKLFFDPRLSGSRQIACASCHEPELGWSDGRTVSFGHGRKELRRNSPTLLNIAFVKDLFWDGRAASLEEQVMEVVSNPDEMHSGMEQVMERFNKIPEYTNEFAKVFGTPEVTLPRVARAIATFERGIVSRPNDFDSFLRGNTNALSDEAIRGLHLFRTRARCANCHHGPTLSDGRFHNLGLTYYGRKLEDLGRYYVTKKPEDVGAFRTPTLRNIARTRPYMHNGLFDLDGVLNMYNAGMPTVRPRPGQENDPLFPKKSRLLQPLGLNQQDLADLKAFLESLTEVRHRIRPPELPGLSTPSAPAEPDRL